MCLYLREKGIEYRAVHLDTGWEHPATDEYVREVLEPAIGPITWIQPPMGMLDLIHSKAMFPSRVRRFCTQQLKVLPFIRWAEEAYDGEPIINAIGIRKAESKARSGLPAVQSSEYGATWRPILRWSVDDVIAIHRRHGLRANPLYYKGAHRVGCWPCIFSRKSEIRMVADMTPEVIDKIRDLELGVTEKAKARYEAKGKPWNGPRAFFSMKARGKHTMTPIDDVVLWSRTAHGGKQLMLIDMPDRTGCMQWGFCDH